MWDLMVLVPYWIGQGTFMFAIMVGNAVGSDEEPLNEKMGNGSDVNFPNSVRNSSEMNTKNRRKSKK